MEFSKRPATLGYMLRALVPSPGLRPTGRFPPLRARWRRHRADPGHLGRFLELTGLEPGGAGVPLLYPHVVGFPLLMVLLTHPRFPVPIWSVLQIRNHLLQHRPFDPAGELELEARVAGQRLLDKGAEVDLHTAVRARGELAWESLNTFYLRGRSGRGGASSPLARAPEVGPAALASWRMPPGPGLRFAGLTGDYNGIHYWDWYARRFGFRRSLHHPPLVLGRCLARLPAPAAGHPQRLDAWLKGPVYYGAEVRLRGTPGPAGTAFALDVDREERPAILGRWTAGAEVAPLLDPWDRPAASASGPPAPHARE